MCLEVSQDHYHLDIRSAFADLLCNGLCNTILYLYSFAAWSLSQIPSVNPHTENLHHVRLKSGLSLLHDHGGSSG